MAYRGLAARYHPDKHQGHDLEDLAREKMAQLNEAYNALSDPRKRAAYDASRSFGTERPGYPPPPSAQPRQAIRKIVRLLFLIGIALATLRFVHSPRVSLIVGLALAAFWFGPRLLRLFFPDKKN